MSEKKEKLIKIIVRRIFILLKLLLSGVKLFFSNSFWKNKLIIRLTVLSLLLNISLWFYFFQNKIESDYPIILHYNLIFGVDCLGNYEKIYLISFVGLILLLFNSILGYILYNREKLASYFLVFSTFAIQIFLIVAGYLIVGVNS